MSTRDDFEIALDHYAGCYLGRHIANREHALTNLHTSMDDVVEEARDKVLALFDAALIAPAPRPKYAEAKRQWFCPFCGKVIYDTDANLARDHAHMPEPPAPRQQKLDPACPCDECDGSCEAYEEITRRRWEPNAPAPRPDEVTDVTLEQRIVAWQRATFPGGRVDGAVRHFDEESIELIAACKGTDEANVHEEIGDVGMLLVAIASGYGTTLSECMEGALQKVQGRTYAYDERLGYSRHVDAAAAHDRKATNG